MSNAIDLADEHEERQDIWDDAPPDLIGTYLAEGIRRWIITRLSTFRQAMSLSQAELAVRSATTQPMLSRFFSGADRRTPNFETLSKLAWALNKEIRLDFVERLSNVPSPEFLQHATNLRDHLADAIAEPPSNDKADAFARHALLQSSALKRCEYQAPSTEVFRSEAWARLLKSTSCRYNVEHMLEPSKGSPRTLRVRVDFAALSNKQEFPGDSGLSLKATVELAYALKPQAVFTNADAFAACHAVKQALSHYRKAVDLLTTAVVSTD